MRFKKLILAIGLVLSMAIPASTEVWPTPCTPSNPINCSRGTWGQEVRDFMDNTFDLLTAKIVSFFSDVDTIHKYATFEAAVTALCPTGDTSPEKTLILPVVTTVAANTTVCNKLTLEFTGKGSLEPAVSITVTVNGPVISAKPLADITGGAGTVTFGSQLLNMPSGNSSGDISGVVDGTIVNADVNASAAISQSKLVDIVNADVAAGAAIVDTKLATISTAGKVRDSALEGRDSILNYADLSAAITAIGSTVKTLVIPTVTASIVSNETIPSTLTLQFTGSGQLNVGSVTLATLTSAEYGTLEFTTTTMIRTSGSWITDSYNVSDATITITGSASNNVTCGVTSATALILTVDVGSCTLVVEAASTAETVNGQDPWTVTINGPLEAPLRQVFSGAGTVTFGPGFIVEMNIAWFGAKDGNADDTDALKAAYAAAKAAESQMRINPGTYTFTSQLLWDGEGVNILGSGRDRTILMKKGDFDGVKISVNGSPKYGGFTLDSLAGQGDTKRGIHIDLGHRITMSRLLVINHGSHGIEFNAGNLSHFVDIQVVSNGGDGFRVEGHVAARPTVSTNAGTFINIDARSNSLVGFNISNGLSNTLVGIIAQNNTGAGFRIDTGRGNFGTVYDEQNGIRPEFTANSIGNFIQFIEGANNVLDSGIRNMIVGMNDDATISAHFKKMNINQFTIADFGSFQGFVFSIPSTGTLKIDAERNGTSTIDLTNSEGGLTGLFVSGDIRSQKHYNKAIISSGSAAPSVVGSNTFILTATTTITDFTTGQPGQVIYLKTTASPTITNNAAIELFGGGDYVMTPGDTLTLVQFTTGVWTEVSRSVN